MRTTGEAGTASLSKTLARKCPALLPILDSVAIQRIRGAGGPGPTRGKNWAFLRDELTTSTWVCPGIIAIRAAAGVPPHYQDLRIIDIVVWMRQNVAGRLPGERGTCQPL